MWFFAEQSDRTARARPIRGALALEALEPRILLQGGLVPGTGTSTHGDAELSFDYYVEPRYSVGGGPQAIMIEDLNGDGLADLVVANSGQGGINVMLGTGSGAFGSPADYASGDSPLAFVIADFNGDLSPDLATANAGSDNVSVLLNDGTGAFGPATDYAAGDYAYAIAAGDINGDTSLDLAVANDGDDTVTILLGVGDGTFVSGATYGVAENPQGIALGDVNEDGDLDLIVGSFQYSCISVMLGAGDGTFGGAADYDTAGSPTHLTLADVNHDGHLDVVTTNSDATVSILLGAGDGSFGGATLYATDWVPNSVVLADFSGDGDVDLAVACDDGDAINVMFGNGDGTFGQVWKYAAGCAPYGVAAGDLDGDGHPDLAVANWSSGDVSLLFRSDGGSFTAATNYLAGKMPKAIAAGDFDADANMDVAVVNYRGHNLSVMLGGGDGTLGSVGFGSYGSPLWPCAVASADFNGDLYPDLAVAGWATANVHVLLAEGDGTFTDLAYYDVGTNPYCMAAADLNEDGRADLAVANTWTDDVSVLLGAGDGTFATAANYAAGDLPRAVAIADFNADGHMDLAVASYGSDDVNLLFGLGDGTFGAPVSQTLSGADGPWSLTAADFNGDGHADLAVVDANDARLSVLLGAGDGSFSSAGNYTVGDCSQHVVASDINGDGVVDLAVPSRDEGAVRVFLGVGDGTFQPGRLFVVSGGPEQLALADFNNDGAVDIASVSGAGVLVMTNTTPGVTNDPPQIALVDPASGTSILTGHPYVIRWADSDWNDNAEVGLYWDTDTDSANNLLGNEGTTWGTIATGISEDDPANSYGWTVNAPAGTAYYLYGTVSDGVATGEDYTATTLSVRAPQTYYVSEGGVDSNPGTLGEPWASPSYGSRQLQSGDTLVIMGGTYVLSDYDQDDIWPSMSGTADAWITIRGETGNRPVLAGRDDLARAIELSGLSYIQIENLEITHDSLASGTDLYFRDGIVIVDQPASNIVLEDLYIHHIDEMGINIQDVNGLDVINCQIEYCGISGMGGPFGIAGGWQNVTISGCSLSYSGHYYQGTPGPSVYDRPDGLEIASSLGPVLIVNTVSEHNRGDGMDSQAANTLIQDCIVANNSCDGVKLWRDGSRVENTLIYGRGDGDSTPSPWAAIVIDSGSVANTDFEIVNVTVDDTLGQNYILHAQYDTPLVPVNLTIRNTIFRGVGENSPIFVAGATNLTAENNLFYMPDTDFVLDYGGTEYTESTIGSLGTGNLYGDPLFVAPAWGSDGDYHLQAGSPAINAGTPTGAPATDLEGTTRDATPDIGSYEYVGPVNVPPTITLNDPTPGTTVSAGDVHGITWTDSDPDSNAVIFLYWDTDTVWANGVQGTDWAIITTSVWEDDANEYPWTVNAPAGGDYYFRGFIYDGATSVDDYTSVPIHVNAAPSITLNDPAPGTTVSPGDVYNITWTDSDPDGNATIFLYWDADTAWGNGTQGTDWDIITTSVWEDDANSYDWTVDAPAGSDYYFRAFINDGTTSDDDYTSVPVHVNAAPSITPTEIAPGTQRYAGQTYTITWADSDPDDEAQITLQWDVDTDLANNSPGNQGTAWGTITTGISEDDPADFYNWQVDAPAPGQYHLWFTIADDYATDSEVTANTIEVLEGAFPIFATHTYSDGVTVRLYDINPGNGVPSEDIVAWGWSDFHWGQTKVVVDPGWVGDHLINLIMLFGDGTDTADLGIEVDGNNGLGSMIDVRTNPQPLGFLASDGYVGTIILGAGITGVVVEAGQEPTAIYCEDYVRTLIAKGDVNGNLLIAGDLTLLEVLGGDLNGDVTLTGSNVGTVMAIAIGGQGGSINGDIQANDNVNTVMAIGGGISGSIQAPTGRVGTVIAIGGPITSPTIYGQTGVNLVEAINGGVASSITSGASLGTVMAINGNLDLSGGRSISAESTINSLMAINGSILGDAAVSPDIYVGNGNLWSLLAVGGGMQNVWVDVNGTGASAGRLSSVYVGGNVTGSRFEAEGLLSSLFALGGFTNNSVQAGSLSVVYVGGTISEDSTDGDTDTIHADAGSYYVIDHLMGFKHITPTASATFGGLIASVA